LILAAPPWIEFWRSDLFFIYFFLFLSCSISFLTILNAAYSFFSWISLFYEFADTLLYRGDLWVLCLISVGGSPL
jgi:hypothetical protein